MKAKCCTNDSSTSPSPFSSSLSSRQRTINMISSTTKLCFGNKNNTHSCSLFLLLLLLCANSVVSLTTTTTTRTTTATKSGHHPPSYCFATRTTTTQNSNVVPLSCTQRRRRKDAFLPLAAVRNPKDSATTSTATTTTTTTTTTTQTIQDEKVDAPASLVFYDNVPEGLVCARGVCVLADFDHDDDYDNDNDGAVVGVGVNDGSSSSGIADGGETASGGSSSIIDGVLKSYLGPRLLLAFASILYGTNFPLGAIMNDALPPSAATCARMVLAAAALSPFLFRLSPDLAGSALLCGCFTALGYTTQSLALVDVSPATVAFLGAATVVVCPTLQALVDKRPMGLRDAPQAWLAAFLCLAGVAILELYDPTSNTLLVQDDDSVGFGDVLALLQAVGFGTSFFLTERMMRGQPDQALPITAVQVSTTALICMAWCVTDTWMGQPGSEAYALPNLFLEPSVRVAAGAVAWTGLVTTALNRVIETASLGKVSSAEASVILATEPLWAALFAALLLSESFGANDYIGGALIVLACLANTLQPTDFSGLFSNDDPATASKQQKNQT